VSICGGTVSSHKNLGFAEEVNKSLKEVGINCWEVPQDRLPLTSVSDLCTLAPVSLRFLLGDTASNISSPQEKFFFGAQVMARPKKALP
jgi:hypothetical protein